MHIPRSLAFLLAHQTRIIGLHNGSERKSEASEEKTNSIDSPTAFVSAIRGYNPINSKHPERPLRVLFVFSVFHCCFTQYPSIFQRCFGNFRLRDFDVQSDLSDVMELDKSKQHFFDGS